MSPPIINNPYAAAHAEPKGPGDARPTAYKILKDNNVVGKLSDKTFLITGGSDGLGLETVRTLAKTGARVFFSARNPEKAAKIVKDIEEEGKADRDLKGARVEFITIDNKSLKSVKQGAEDFLRRSDKLNVLITNAGIANVPHALSDDGFEIQFAVNHLAHFYLFELLKPLLLKSLVPGFHSRVIAIASTAHAFSTVQFGNIGQEQKVTSNYHPMLDLEGDYTYNPGIAYGQTKTANIWMANEIERRYGGQGLHGLSVHPGNIFTAGYGIMDPRIAAKFAPFFEMPEMQAYMKSVEQGAATQVLAAVGKDYEGKGGFYMDDCRVAEPIPEGAMPGFSGYQSWAYSPEGEKKLWSESLKMVGLKDDQ
ncbi:hypothetical protein LTR78_009459 [Recurvomyces mirabilis]|uniref:Uncharacterized protein n=1 Tax=Recurvomyces mirabilis TaxID=574656 RepID=A0AAE0TPG0_9PEZI|nr:hypothetical protein LTR78_009459 [Recurvomyces mirabilis]KAK5152364.1 hypothetical protein LTS14_008311 [Recurvomyces mirabilis]